MKGIGIGVSDFEQLITNDCYFIDKSLFIKHIIDNKSSVALITRPRRFGKTLNMSMARYYFDCTIESKPELFNGLKIIEQGEKYTSKMGDIPCIYMTLKDLGSSNYEEMLQNMQNAILNIYKEHRYLMESEKIYPDEKEWINNVYYRRMNEIDMKNAIRNLSEFLYRIYDKPVMLLLDEYDVPLQHAYVNGFYDEAVKFFKSFYGTSFKDNRFLQKTIITGVSRVSKESIFSRCK